MTHFTQKNEEIQTAGVEETPSSSGRYIIQQVGNVIKMECKLTGICVPLEYIKNQLLWNGNVLLFNLLADARLKLLGLK